MKVTVPKLFYLKTFTNFSNDELISMLKEKNPDCISILYDKYAPAVYGSVYKEVNDIEIAEAILEQTFIYIWNNPSTMLMATNHVLLSMLKIAKIITAKVLNEMKSKSVDKQNRFIDFKMIRNNPLRAFAL